MVLKLLQVQSVATQAKYQKMNLQLFSTEAEKNLPVWATSS